MNPAYFSKSVPKTPIYVPSGDPLNFATLDGKTGYYQTDDETAITYLRKMQKEGRGGLTEISKEDYEENYGKKKEGSKPYVYRCEPESIQAGIAPDTMLMRVIAPTETATAEKAPEPPSLPAPKPRIGKRQQIANE